MTAPGELGAGFLMTLLALMGGCATMKPPAQARPQTVEAKGKARFNPQNRPLSRAKALARAEKSALEKVVGVRISEATQLNASVITHEAIDAESAGFINRYKILREGVHGGVYQVDIEAAVSPLATSDRPRASLFSKAPPNSPSLMILMGSPLKENELSRLALSSVEEGFKKRGFSFATASSQNSSRRFIVTVQDISSEYAHFPWLGNLKSCRTKMDIQIQDTLNRRMIVNRWVEAAGIGGSETLALDRALANTGKEAGVKAAEDLAQNLWAQL